MAIVSVYLRMSGGKRAASAYSIPGVLRGSSADPAIPGGITWALAATDVPAFTADHAWTIPGGVPARLFGGTADQVTLDIEHHAYILFLQPNDPQLYFIEQENWAATWAANDVCRVAWVDATWDLVPRMPRPITCPTLVWVANTAGSFARYDLHGTLVDVIPYLADSDIGSPPPLGSICEVSGQIWAGRAGSTVLAPTTPARIDRLTCTGADAGGRIDRSLGDNPNGVGSHMAIIDDIVWIATFNNSSGSPGSIERFNLDGTVYSGGPITGNNLSSPGYIIEVGDAIWVGDGYHASASTRVSRFNPDGTPYAGGNLALTSSPVISPRGMCAVGTRVWVGDGGHDTINIYDVSGTFLGRVPDPSGYLLNIEDITLIGGEIWVVCVTFTSGDEHIVRFNPDGTYASGTPNPITNTAGELDSPVALVLAFVPTTPTSVPDAPGLLSAAAGDSDVDLTWIAPSGSGITSYTVREATLGVVYTGNTLSATITGLTNGTAYSFSVTATNTFGTGSASNTLSATPVGVPSITNNSPSGGCGGDGTCTISLVGSAGTGNNVTLTATVNHDLGPTIWWLWIVDESNTQIGTALGGGTVSVVSTSAGSGTTHTYTALLSTNDTSIVSRTGDTNTVVVTWP